MPDSLPTPGIQVWYYKDAPIDLRIHTSPRAEWLMVASKPFTEGLRQYLAKKGIVMESRSFDDGRLLCWGGPGIGAARRSKNTR